MLYATFTLWLLLALLVGAGVYRLWAGLVKPAWIGWALLPGTLVSEMAYIFGCLITGGEIRRAKILPGGGGKGKGGSDEPATEASPRLRLIGPVAASMLSMAACAGAILAAHALLGEPVIGLFGGGAGARGELPRALPTSSEAFWEQLAGQVWLLRRICRAWTDLDWLDWRVPVFVYLAACLSIRLAPVGKPVRPTIIAVVVWAALLALAAAVARRFRDCLDDLWPLLTYVWSSLLFFLAVTLLIRGVVLLVAALLGRKKAA